MQSEAILLNAVILAGFFLILCPSAIAYGLRIKKAQKLLDEKDANIDIATNFFQLSRRTASKAYMRFFAALGIFIVVLFAGSFLIAYIIEPKIELNDILTFLVLVTMTYGVAVIGATIIVAFIFARYMQVRALNTFLKKAASSRPKSKVIEEVKLIMRYRVAQEGVAILSRLAALSSILMGFAYLAIFYLAAQHAIECARNSKCMQQTRCGNLRGRVRSFCYFSILR